MRFCIVANSLQPFIKIFMKSLKFFFASFFIFLFSFECKAQLLPSIAIQDPISKCDYCGCSQGISPLETGSTGVRFEYGTLYLNAQYEGSQKQPNPSKQNEVLQTERASFYFVLQDLHLQHHWKSRMLSGNRR